MKFLLKVVTECFKEEDKNDDLHLHVAAFICQHKTTTINTTKRLVKLHTILKYKMLKGAFY